MRRSPKVIEAMLVPAIAIICLLVSLADFFGLLNLIPTNRIPMLTLLLISLILSSLSFVHHKSAESHQDVQRLLSKIEPEHMKKALQQIDPHLRRILKDDYFIDILEFFQTAVKESKVQLNDAVRFHFYLIRTLQSYPKATFLSTASYLWMNSAIEQAVRRFIENGGKMKQVYFVKDAEALASPEIQNILARQQQMGIQVHIVFSTLTPNDLKKNFIVESRGKIAWETHMDDSGHIGSSMLTTNKLLTASYCRIFEKLRESEIRK